METDSVASSMRNSEFLGEDSSSEEGVSIRMVNNSIAMGYISSTDTQSVKDIIEKLQKRSNMPGRNVIDESGNVVHRWDETGTRKVQDLQESDRLQILKENDRVMVDHDISTRMNFVDHVNTREIYMNSSGSLINAQFSRIGYSMAAGYKHGSDFEQIYRQFGTTGGMEAFEALNVSEKIEEAVCNLGLISRSPSAPHGIFDVIVSPEIAGIVAHESCGHPTEWDRIIGREGSLAGESFLTGKELPFRIGSEAVSVIDDPTIKGSYGYYKYDDEGVKARRRYLYKNGYTSEFIHSRESAARMAVEPNGGGRVSQWNREPLARMSTTYIEPGDHSFEELVEDVKDGIYIKSYTEWNIDDIRFNEKYVGSEAFIIKNGELQERVRRPSIEINTVKFYSAIDAVSKELEFYAGTCGKGEPEQGLETWMGGPSMRLRQIRIS